MEIRLQDPNHELQADCLAGYFIQKGNKELGVTRENILEMSSVAYSIGDKTHGTGAQRTYALLSGMGRVDADCSYASIEKLVKGDIDDPFIKHSQEQGDLVNQSILNPHHTKKMLLVFWA